MNAEEPTPGDGRTGSHDEVAPEVDLSVLLDRVRRLDGDAAAEVLPLVYGELRGLADAFLRREGAAHTLQPTAVVHEAYLKLSRGVPAQWQDRAQFFGIAARAMRQVLVDHARARRSEKRGGPSVARVTLVEGLEARAGGPIDDFASGVVDVVALHDALEELTAMDERTASVVELRFFGGLTIRETADALGCATTTVEDDWSFARAWLQRKLQEPGS